MPAREREREEGRFGDGSLAREIRRGDMSPDMVDPDERDPVRRRQPLREIDRDEQRADPNRDADNGSDYPKAKMDPSGMVYEGTLSNPVEGATVKVK